MNDQNVEDAESVKPVGLEENILYGPGMKGKPKSIDDAPNAKK